MPSTIIEWNPPLYGGQGIENYTIRIPDIGYVEHLGNVSSYIIKAGAGSKVDFNRSYIVEVVAISTCGSNSEPSNISVRISASGK